MVSASASPSWVESPTQATYPSGRINTAVGAVTAPRTGSSHVPTYVGVDQLNPIRPWRDVEAAGLAEVEQHRPGIVQQGEDPQRAVGGDQVEIGHAASEQRVSLAEVVMNVQTGHHPRRTACAARPCSRSSDMISRKALVRSSVRSSATCAIVLRNTRAATGCRSAW